MNKATIFLLILISTINAWAQSTQPSVARHFKTGRFNVAIFPATYPVDEIEGARFTPTVEEVRVAEHALNAQLMELNKDLANQEGSVIIHRNLRKYKRQYFGYIDKTGQKVLLINNFWKKIEHTDWLNSKVSVLDGGSHYWSVKYSINNRMLFDVAVNGSS